MLPHWLRRDLQDKWESLKAYVRLLGIREWINEHPRAIICVTTVSAGLLLIALVMQLIPHGAPQAQTLEREWFYDLNTGRLFAVKAGRTPPIKAPSGPRPDGRPAGVRAYVLSYTEEPNESERFVAFLETSADSESNVLAQTRPASVSEIAKWGRGKLIRRPDDETWVPADSRQGQQIYAEAFAPDDDGRRPTYCRPQ